MKKLFGFSLLLLSLIACSMGKLDTDKDVFGNPIVQQKINSNLISSLKKDESLKIHGNKADINNIKWNNFSKGWKKAIAKNIKSINGNEEELTEKQKKDIVDLKELNYDCSELNCPKTEKINNLEPLKSMNQITSLNLKSNAVKDLKSDVFKSLTKLENLSLEENKIKTIENKAFLGLDKLKILSLNKNHIKSLPEDAFSFLDELTSLTVNEQKSEEGFKYEWTEEQKLAIAKQLVSTAKVNFDGKNEVKGNRKRLEWSSLSLAWKKALARNTRSITGKEETLTQSQRNEVYNLIHFTYNCSYPVFCSDLEKIKDLTPFKLMKNLTMIDIAFNKVTQRKGAFKELTKLRQLLIPDNNLKEIETDFFEGLNNLESLNLMANDLSKIDAEIFKHTPKLNSLILDKNKITSLKKEDFKNSPNLISLLLSENEINSIESGTFDNMLNLKEFSIFKNKLTSINENTFNSLDNLKQISIASQRNLDGIVRKWTLKEQEDIKAQIIYTSKVILVAYKQDYGTRKKEKVNYINWTTLSQAWKKAIAKNVGSITGNESNLSLTQKKLVANLTEFTYDCQMLRCSRSEKISDLTPLKYMKKLTSLLIKANNIVTLKKEDFENLSNLEELSLQKNQISSVKNETFKNLKNLKTLILEENRILSLEENSFKGLLKLKYLNLNKNYLDLNNFENSISKKNTIDSFRYLNQNANLQLDSQFLNPYHYWTEETMTAIKSNIYPTSKVSFGYLGEFSGTR